jgi:hypothetical protein
MKKYLVLFKANGLTIAELEMADLPCADDFVVVNYVKYTIYDFNWIVSAHFDGEATLQRVEIQLREVGRYHG